LAGITVIARQLGGFQLQSGDGEIWKSGIDAAFPVRYIMLKGGKDEAEN